MGNSAVKHDFLNKYRLVGNERFYKFLLAFGIDRLIKLRDGVSKGTNPEIEFLEYYDHFLVLYRRSGEGDYLDLAKIFRRAAHKIYRAALKSNMTEKNPRFLNVVPK